MATNITFLDTVNLSDNSQIHSGQLLKPNGNVSVDWENQILSGIWNANGLEINGIPLSSAAYNQSGAYLFSTIAISGVLNQYINFPGNLGNSPYVIVSLNNISDTENIFVQASGITSSGYTAIYSNRIDGSGYILTTLAALSTNTGLATTVINQITQNIAAPTTGSYFFNTSVISGVLNQFILFPSNLGNTPYVIATINNITGTENILVQVSGITSSGYYACYSNNIDSTGYILTTLASLSTTTGLATTVVINQIPSGFITTGQSQEFSTSILTGFITQNISFPFNFPSVPRVFVTVDISGNNIYMCNISGTTISGYTAIFSNIIQENGVILNTYASIQ